jgi:hypothetical protein
MRLRVDEEAYVQLWSHGLRIWSHIGMIELMFCFLVGVRIFQVVVVEEKIVRQKKNGMEWV